MILLMLDAGPRISEVADLRLEHLDLEDRQARIMGRRRKQRHIPLGQRTARALVRYITAFRPEPVNPANTLVFLSWDEYPMTRNSLECVIRLSCAFHATEGWVTEAYPASESPPRMRSFAASVKRLRVSMNRARSVPVSPCNAAAFSWTI